MPIIAKRAKNMDVSQGCTTPCSNFNQHSRNGKPRDDPVNVDADSGPVVEPARG